VRRVVIVGASLAGFRAAQTLRREGFDGLITLVGDEARRPYDRPPLSKRVLDGRVAPEAIALERGDEDLELDWRLGVRATGFDAADRTVTLDGGEELGADGVILACGARPRTLPGTDGLAGVHVLRRLDDSLALRAALESRSERVVVIGAGFIGAEVAATCRGRGLAVTMVEAGPTPLGRVLPAAIGSFVTELHLDEGVDVRVGVGVAGIDLDDGGRARAVRLVDGTSIDADVVVVGIGVSPNTGWLEGSGLVLDDGVRCDATCLAAAGIVAAGDVASWPNSRFGEVMRVEQWENAVEQGEHAARRLFAELDGTGPGPDFAPIPWFWSDQYDRKIQMAGRPAASDGIAVVEGTLAERRFVALFECDGRCTGVLGVNRPRHVMQARMKLAESLDWESVRALFP
jgi:3-phenylpropionate/trans-cinnamate dioxygenase ferredoxin reductase component